MKWKLLLLLSLGGILTGVITVYYIPARAEALISTPVFLLSAYFIARYAQAAYFLHGFVLGIINSALVTASHILLSDTYFANHQKEAIQFTKMSVESGASIVQTMLIMGAFMAVVSAIFMGFFAMAGSKIMAAIDKERG